MIQAPVSRPLLVLFSFFLFPFSLFAADWLHWRGPEQTGVSREKDLPDKWSPDPKAADNNLIWTAPYGCRSTPLVHDGRIYIINNVGSGVTEQERVLALDEKTGKLLWEHKFNVWHTGIVSNRLGWTNLTVDPDTGNLYAHGTQGMLFCFEGKTGKVLWSHSLTEEYGRVSGYGGRLASPIVDGDLVIIGMINGSWGDQARGGNRFVAFDKKTGKVVWWSDPAGPIKGTYSSSPVIAVINGQRLFITGSGDGSVLALKPLTGEKVWSYPFGNVAIDPSPVVGPDGKVYITHGEESEGTSTQGRIICVDATKIKDGKPTEVWKLDGTKAAYSSPLLHDGRLYVCSTEARLLCLDAQTGKPLWKRPFAYGRLSRGSPVWADGKIYVADVNAHFHILKPGDAKCDELHDQFFPDKGGKGFVETNCTPAIVNGHIYFATRDELYCIGKKDHNAKADPIPTTEKEKPAASGAAIAAIRIVPADVVLTPGEGADFKVRAYDANGQFIRELDKAEWTLPTPPPPPKSDLKPPALRGTINEGKLTVDAKVPNQQGYVEAKVGEVTGRARVRVMSPLPINLDFSKVPAGATPGGLVNCQGKFVIEELADKSKVLKKISPLAAPPPVARANAYIGLPNMTDYTIQADVLGKEVQDNRADFGVIANRYTLMLDGKRDPADKKKRLRIVSWDALPRVDHGIPFDWTPDTWYTMKLTVEVQKDKGIIRGKVWPVGKPEPKEWTIEFEDPVPNREGAPGIYGYAPGIVAGTDVLYRNISITPNKKAN
ncbi:MAG: PQQ-binding-like beta-propeller repeat protein [Gemmataceae bacterium]|nr:PQQ-binding-like beta-propeller repeat protein [Gemmataceae bacterium]